MGIAMGFVFLGLELVCIALTILAIVRNGFARLNSAVGIARDGFPPGTKVPPWSLADIEGHLRVTPALNHWQFLVFVDQSLASFPELISGMHRLDREIQEVEVLIISRESREDCQETAALLGLQVSVVPVEPVFYERFRVRIMPFAFLLDPDGSVHWVGLVNTEEQLFHAWRMSRVGAYEGSSLQEV